MNRVHGLLVGAALLGGLGAFAGAAEAGTFHLGSPAPVRLGFVKVAHVVPGAALESARLSRADAIAAVVRYWSGAAGLTPESVHFGSIDFDDPHNPTMETLKKRTPTGLVGYGKRDVWVVTYSVNLSPPAAPPNPGVGVPTIHTMAFIVDDSTDTVLEAKGYFD